MPEEMHPAPPASLARMRIYYARGAELRYVGNLDMQQAWERTLRRARLPVAFSQGFNPRPRFHMAAALPLGFTSRCELLDVWFSEPVDAKELAERIRQAAPPGLEIQQVETVDLREPALQGRVTAAVYRALLRETPVGFDLPAAVGALLQAQSLPREWRKKAYDLRPLIYSIKAEGQTLEMHLSAREGATGRPEEVLAALGLDPTTARVERVQLVLEEKPVGGGEEHA